MVIGVGNEFRRDDGAGPEVVARLRGHLPDDGGLVVSDGEPARLIEAWAVHWSRGRRRGPGRARRSRAAAPARPGPGRSAGPWPVSSHGLGLEDAIGLARALDRMPGRLIVHAVEAADLSQGTGLTPAVAAVIDTLVAAVLRDLACLPVAARLTGTGPNVPPSRHLRPYPHPPRRSCHGIGH